MANISGDDFDKLGTLLQQGHRLTDAVSLAGTATALPLARLRARQSALEARRTEARLGAGHQETQRRQAQAKTLAARTAEVGRDLARQSLQRPDTSEEAALYGRVTRRGEPQPSLIVAALDEQDQVLVHSCTGLDGDYSLSFPPGREVRIEVRGEGGKRLFRDERGSAYPPYRATHRDIELSTARPPCPEDGKPGTAAGIQVPNLVGMHVEKAAEALAALGLDTGNFTHKPGDSADLVLSQDPPAGSSASPGTTIDLVVATADARPAAGVGDLTGQSLSQAVGEIRKAGAELGTVTVSTDGTRTPIVAASAADRAGAAVHLDISTRGGPAKLMEVAATVIGATPEGNELDLANTPAAAEWLRQHKLTNLAELREAAAMDDAALRKRLRIGAKQDLGVVRRALQAAVSRIREV
jgi:phosphoglycolate phosphatase-like HAD superfamily hydrolase